MSVFIMLDQLRWHRNSSRFQFADCICAKAALKMNYHHLTADYSVSKCLGLSTMIWFMKGRAYMAVPSTTSMTTQPTILSIFSTLVSVSTTLQAIDPPSECPTTMMFCYEKRCMISFRVSMASAQRVYIEKSELICFFEEPCPLRS